MASQSKQILHALKKGRKLTPLDALKDFRCFRLGARIWELKQAGHRIERAMVEVHSGKHVAQYSMRRKAA